MRDSEIVSAALPGGSLVDAALDRRVMAMADRGQSSGAIGDRWAEVCSEVVRTWVRADHAAPNDDEPFVVNRVVRLDHQPQIASAASKRKMQNPDFLAIGDRDGAMVVQGLDAKFSAETAKSRQVSAQVVRALLDLGPLIEELTGPISPDADVVDGMFMCPDYPLTHLVFSGRPGIMRPAVSPREVMLIETTGGTFFDPVAGGELIPAFADVDRLPLDIDESLMASLYYFRLVRAVAGIQSDERRPLLDGGTRYEVDYGIIAAELPGRREGYASAWQMVQDWDLAAERIRAQRQAVERVAGLPVVAAELRARIDRVASSAGKYPPSVNQVRKRIGAWYRRRLLDLVGPVSPPVPDLGPMLDRIAHAGRTLTTDLEGQTTSTIDELVELAPRPQDLARDET